MKAHAKTLVRLIEKTFNGKAHVVEVGVWRGYLSAILLDWFPEVTVTMVDPWLPYKLDLQQDMDSIMQEAIKATDFVATRRSIVRMPSIKAAAEMAKESVDLVFIDALHEASALYADLRAWYPIVKHGGILSCHDYDGRGDRKYGWGMKQTCDVFCEEYDYQGYVGGGLVWWIKKK